MCVYGGCRMLYRLRGTAVTSKNSDRLAGHSPPYVGMWVRVWPRGPGPWASRLLVVAKGCQYVSHLSFWAHGGTGKAPLGTVPRILCMQAE